MKSTRIQKLFGGYVSELGAMVPIEESKQLSCAWVIEEKMEDFARMSCQEELDDVGLEWDAQRR
eukprot:8520836-Prorocentrum_lima.AAC.1